MTRRRIVRGAGRFLGLFLIGSLLYVLSSGPATWWIVSAVSGRQAAHVDPATYDRRLSTYYRLYGPLIRRRLRLRYRNQVTLSQLFWSYEDCFARVRKLTDGREVTTTLSPAPLPGESLSQYVERLVGKGAPTPKPGTEIFHLPLSGRNLVIWDPAEDELIRAVFDAAFEHSVTPYANLQVP